MEKERYVAYVSTYTQGDRNGIKIYDVDMESGRFLEKDKVEITNSSYVTISHNEKHLYSITDLGVEAYGILPDGGLKFINFASIKGMRGCYLATDYTDKYLFVAGYHDGKLTVLKVAEDGSVGDITDEVYHKGLGVIAERSSRPHINCARMTHDNKYLLVADQGMDHVKVYRFDPVLGKVQLADIIHSELDANPRHIKISKDGRYVYVVNEFKCSINVFSYEERNGQPIFEKLQTVPTCHEEMGSFNAASALTFSEDHRYLLSSNAGGNTVVLFEVDESTGLLREILELPVGGEYPKDASLFPNNRFLVSLNHETNDMTFFHVDMEKGTIIMNGPPIKVDVPNCITFHKLQATGD